MADIVNVLTDMTRSVSMPAPSMILCIALLQSIVYLVFEEPSGRQQDWSQMMNLSSPVYSPDGRFLALKAGRLRHKILERRLLIIDVAKWQPVYAVLIQRRKLPEKDDELWEPAWQEVFKEYHCYGFTWLDSDRLAYFDLQGKLFTLDLRQSPPRVQEVWKAEHIYRLTASHKEQYLAAICRITEFSGIGCIIIDTRSWTPIYKHATAMEDEPYPVAAFSDDGKWLAVSDGELIDVINLEQKKIVKQINLQDGLPVGLKFGPIPNVLIAMTCDGNLYFCDLKRRLVTGTTNVADVGEFAALEVVIVVDRRLLLSWNESGIALYDLDKLKICWTRSLQNYGCALCPDQRAILAITTNRQLLRLSLSTGEIIEKMPQHKP